MRGPAWNGQGSNAPSKIILEEEAGGWLAYWNQYCQKYLTFLTQQTQSSIAHFEELWGIEIA